MKSRTTRHAATLTPDVERHHSRLVVAGDAAYNEVATLDPFGPSRDVIAELEDRVLSDRVEVMLTVNEARKPSPHNFEKRVERGKCGVLRFHL